MSRDRLISRRGTDSGRANRLRCRGDLVLCLHSRFIVILPAVHRVPVRWSTVLHPGRQKSAQPHSAIHVMNKDLPGKSTRKCTDAPFAEMLK
jgi:hypothetical protein